MDLTHGAHYLAKEEGMTEFKLYQAKKTGSCFAMWRRFGRSGYEVPSALTFRGGSPVQVSVIGDS